MAGPRVMKCRTSAHKKAQKNALPPPRFMDLRVWWDGPVGFLEKQVEQPRRAGFEDVRQEGADEGGSIAATIRGVKKRGRWSSLRGFRRPVPDSIDGGEALARYIYGQRVNASDWPLRSTQVRRGHTPAVVGRPRWLGAGKLPVLEFSTVRRRPAT